MVRRKDGLYQEAVPITVGGRTKYKYFYGKRKADVLRKIADYEEEQENLSRGRTFEVVASEWWKSIENDLAANTIKGYTAHYKRAIAEFGKIPMQDIRPVDINRFIADFVKKHHAADKTARTQLSVVNLICKYGVSCGDLEANPARDLDVPKHLPHRAREMPSNADIAAVKASVALPFGLFAYMAMYTGCRRNELLALTWEDIDIEERTITINKSLYQIAGGTPLIKLPKTEKGIRVLPIMDKLLPYLNGGSGLVFKNPTTGGYITDGTFTLLWNRYKEASGVTCTPHQLRHCYATMLFEAGVSESDAQELLGHAQISTTKDIYTHIRESRKKAVREGLYSVDIR